jgi:glycerol-3-phosphate dehydrogenase (NAD(P)+)
MTDPQNIAVIGAGSWGTALAVLLSRLNRPACLWARDVEQVNVMQQERVNRRYLPGISLPDSLLLSHQLQEVIQHSRDVLIVVPSHAFRSTVLAIKPYLTGQHRLAWATKGFEPGAGKLMHEIVQDELGDQVPVAVISGPTFAREVARGLPTAVTVASHDTAFATYLAERLHDDTFRAYTSEDLTGVEIGGSVKNVLAIAAGIADGLGFGANTRAALITRGLAEMMRLGIALGGQRETFMGLAGLGDLVLTCTDDQSRNRRFGLALGQGHTVQEALDSIDQVVEGAQTAKEVHLLATREGVDMPITEQVFEVINEGQSPQDAVHALLARVQKPETL